MLVPSGIHAKYPIPRNAESLRNPRFSRAFTSKITHSIPRRPLKKGLPAEGCLDQEPPAVLLMSWGFMKTAMAMVRDGFPFPSFVSAGATYFSGIRRAARSSALWASRS
jgi:hypothetical protein